MPLERVAIVGGGAWGTALAQAAAMAGRAVTLVVRDPAVAETVNREHRNPACLGPQLLSNHIRASLAFDAPADFVILAVPAQASRAAIAALGAAALAGKPVVLSAK